MTQPEHTVLQDPYARIGYKLHLLLHTGQLLMESGADTNRVVRDMTRAAAFMGIPEGKMHLHIMYTTLMLNVSDDDHSYTSFRKCRHHGINMTIISAVSKLSWRAIRQNYSLEMYEAELDRIQKLEANRHYSELLSAICAGLACGGMCKLFGGDWIAFFFTALCAAPAFSLRRLCNKLEINTYAGIAISSFTATLLAYFTQFFSNSSTPWHPLIACAIFIVPGIPLINSVDDMLNNYIVAGTTRAINTLLIIGGMTFGIVLAIRLGNVPDIFTALNVMPTSLYLSDALAAAVAAAGLSVIFNVPRRLLPATAIGGIISICLRNFFALELDLSQTVSAFISATAISLISLRAVHWFHTPIHVITIPSIIPMVPGVLLYRVLFAIINIKTLDMAALMSAIQNGIEAILIIVAMTVGTAVPHIFARRYIEKNSQLRLEHLLAKRAAGTKS
ncbi:MAG: threonine/serine ThrE exporter family protein [Selenomonadaceae bacterium]|jgi:uncharacterized membrane protein YjjP (DUF1212 family)